MSGYLITGAAMGLGQALTRQLVAAGHEVILLDKEFKALNALYDELDSDLVALYPMDLLGADVNDYQKLQDVLAENYGALDGVFLNAAILPAFTPIEHFDFMQWYEVLHTNLNANFHLTQMTLPILNKAESGKLVAITDENIKLAPAYYGAYGVAKAGLEQLMRTVAEENRDRSAEIYVAKLKTFATDTRGRLFPGENPATLPKPSDMASHLLDIVLHGLNAELVKKL
ncbi:MAG: SDR family NAD(P)-dependent oxidoreductase [Thiotrichales bacterium]|nr:SDR family NAD(P)-dependent oxidoreductase [Thiotrichales bacterium]